MPQQPRLRGVPCVAGCEPVVQPSPPVPPRVKRQFLRPLAGGSGVRALRDCVGCFPARRELQEPFVAGSFKFAQKQGDLPAGVRQVGDELVDVVDQPFLVSEEPVDIPVGEVDRAPQR